MKKLNKKIPALFLLFLVCVLVSGCGCGTKKKDAATQKVLEITITPAVTPTKAPDELSKDAVASNGNITMVNEYLVQKEGQNAPAVSGDNEDGTNSGTGQNGLDGSGTDGENDGGDEGTDNGGES